MVEPKVSERLYRARKSRGFTQADIAKATGTTNTYICVLELGRQLPSPKYLVDFCRKVGIDYKYMARAVVSERVSQVAKRWEMRYRAVK